MALINLGISTINNLLVNFEYFVDSYLVQYLFDLVKDIIVLHCGNTMHLDGFREMETHA